MKIAEVKKLEEVIFNQKRQQYPSAPLHSIPKVTYSDSTANGLTKCLIDFLKVNKHKAWRQSSEGRYRPGQTVTDVIGRVRQMKGSYLPGQNNGVADVCAIIKGLFCAFEVKMNDSQSEAQERYQREVEQSGGKYFIVHSFDEFMKYYKQLTQQ